mmetsp:Transcript_7795/g.5846  ORF Transcript_7795/g.5846 Transcript_7795/m.5846 type:complete len:91 (+) Transcript_7795:1345-1617(+)
MLFLKLLNAIIHQTLIKVFTTQMCISCCSTHFKDSIVDCEQRYIKGSTTQIEYQNIFFFSRTGRRIGLTVTIQSIGNCSSSRLIQYTFNF